MKNSTGEPFAFVEVDEKGGFTKIYYGPTPKLDGYYWYSSLTGFGDISDIQVICNLINENKERFE